VRQAIERALVDDRTPNDPLTKLSSLGAPTADVEQMLAEIEAGRPAVDQMKGAPARSSPRR